ncbi:MAG: aminotransferase class I/II-fold pyridoxal phosphate-dependent enzyme, partial [Armatimonadota bacterium]
AQIKAKMIEEGNEPIDFGIGDPDMPTPEYVIEALCEAAHDPATHQYDESGYGLHEFKQAVSDFMDKRFGVQVDPDGEVQCTIGCKESLAHIIWAYIDPSDIVLVPDPAYSVYKVQTTWCGGAPFPMPLLPENGFLPDLDAIPEPTRKEAKMMFLNYPNNPTGAVADLTFFEEVVEFAREYQILVVNDCAYSEVRYEDYQTHSILEVEEAKECAIEMHSFSKTFNMTGWRVAWACGGEEFVDALSTAKSNVDSGTFMAIQRAAIAALEGYDEFIDELMSEYTRRRDALVDGLQRLGCPIEAPDATFYVWVPIPDNYDTAADFSKDLLTKCGVLCIPGAVYGAYGEGFVRFSLTIGGDDKIGQIEEAINRIDSTLSLEW